MDTSPEKFYDSLLSYEAPTDDFVSSLAEPHAMEEPEEVPPEDYKVGPVAKEQVLAIQSEPLVVSLKSPVLHIRHSSVAHEITSPIYPQAGAPGSSLSCVGAPPGATTGCHQTEGGWRHPDITRLLSHQ